MPDPDDHRLLWLDEDAPRACWVTGQNPKRYVCVANGVVDDEEPDSEGRPTERFTAKMWPADGRWELELVGRPFPGPIVDAIRTGWVFRYKDNEKISIAGKRGRTAEMDPKGDAAEAFAHRLAEAVGCPIAAPRG